MKNVYEKQDSTGLAGPAPDYIHICVYDHYHVFHIVYDHYIQRSYSPTPHGQSKPNFMCNFYRKPNKLYIYIYINGPGHMTKRATMPIYYVQNQKFYYLEVLHEAFWTKSSAKLI